ncbi:MAG: S1 RNA-binding domain-containing protein [Candidatus Firestonebacteria bacterium]
MIENEGNIKKEDYNMETVLSESFAVLEEGKLIKAKVIKVSKEGIFVDVGYKSDGVIPINEFMNGRGEINIAVGDEVDVVVDRIEDKEGLLVLSKFKADMLKSVDTLERAYKDKDVLDGKIIREIRGGYIVNAGVEAFLPNSQLSLEEVGGIENAIGKVIPVKVIKFGREKGEIILSHKVALKDKNKRVQKETWDNLKEGDLVKGVVKSITSYGAFVDVNGVTGLLHISDISWGKVAHPAEILVIDSIIEIKIIKIDREKKRMSFGLKQLLEDPWSKIEEKYSIGSKAQGKIVNIVDYGAFIKLEEGIEGLLHISDISWTKSLKIPSEILAVGDNIEVKILNIDKENRKILFGLKQLETDPFIDAEKKFTVDSKVIGLVTGYSASGILLELEGGIEGFLHKRDISWTIRFSSLKGLFRKGEKVEVVILSIDRMNRRTNVGTKQLVPDPWKYYIPEKYKVGTVVDCKVTKLANFGVFVDLEKDLEGFIHISELLEEAVTKIEDVVKVGDIKKAKIIKLDLENRKINLSIKEYNLDLKKEELKKYNNSNEVKSTFGDVLNK